MKEQISATEDEEYPQK